MMPPVLMFTLAMMFAVSFLSPIVLPLGALHLLYGCNTKTMANVTDISLLDAVTCNATLYLSEYKTHAHVLVPCMHVIRCLPHYGIYDDTCNNMLVLTNHNYQAASCIKPLLYHHTYMSRETVETAMATTLTALVIVLSLVAIVTTKAPMSFP